MTTPAPAPHTRRMLARRIVAFAGAPFISLIAPFFFLPVLARLAGEDAWVAIAVGQSVGGFAALVAGMGYPTLAPPVLAQASDAARRRYVATSLVVRGPVWFIAACAGAVVAALLAPGPYAVEASATAVVLSIAGLAPTWYWIGVGRAMPILWAEVLPRAGAMVLAAAALLLGGALLWYPVLLGVAMVAGPAVVYTRIARGGFTGWRRREALEIARRHPAAVIAETAAGAYNALAVTLVAHAANVGGAAQYVSGDKAYRIGQYGVSSLGNALQGWVVERGEGGVRRRMNAAIGLHLAFGIGGGTMFAFMGPALTRFLFGADIAIAHLTAAGFGVAIVGISAGTVFGRIGLVMLGARKAFMSCVVAASVLGAAGLVIGASAWGAAGAAWALGSTELASGVAQATVLAVVWRRRVRAGLPMLRNAVPTP